MFFCSRCQAEHSDDQQQGHSLRSQIDMDRVTSLNASSAPESATRILKQHQDGMLADDQLCLMSELDCDQDLVLHVPFVLPVRIKSILVWTSPSSSSSSGSGSSTVSSYAAPMEMRAWINREDLLDFGMLEQVPSVQQWDMVDTCTMSHHLNDVPSYQTRQSKFQNVHSITLHFPRNFSADDEVQTRLDFVGFMGEWDDGAARRQTIVAVYEAQANPADHLKSKSLMESQSHLI